LELEYGALELLYKMDLENKKFNHSDINKKYDNHCDMKKKNQRSILEKL